MTQQTLADSRPAGARGGIWFGMVLTAFEIGASIWIFHYAKGHGASDVGAYLWACLAPVIGAVAYFVRSRDLSGASIAILSFNALSAAVAVVGRTDAKMLLYKDCVVTAVVGLIFLATLLLGKPLAYHFGQRFAGGGTHEGDQWWESMWETYPSFRRAQRQITVVWGVVFLIESVIKALAIRATDYTAGYVWDQLLPIAAFVVAGALTVTLVRRARAGGEAANVAVAQTTPTAQADRGQAAEAT